MAGYRIRHASVEDLGILARQRVAMFEDMDVDSGGPELAGAFREWLEKAMPAGVYRSWLVETETGEVVGGGGVTTLPWPPGPIYKGGRVAFVFNVYTEPAHRGKGVARRLMDAIHVWCRAEGIQSVVLNASTFGQPLYESMGYRVSPSPTMYLTLSDPEGGID